MPRVCAMGANAERLIGSSPVPLSYCDAGANAREVNRLHFSTNHLDPQNKLRGGRGNRISVTFIST
jgi:hypothetical protein